MNNKVIRPATIQPEVMDILKKLAIKYNKPLQVIEEIYKSQWMFIKTKITEDPDNFKTIMLPKWGKYYLQEGKLNWIKYHQRNKELKNESNTK